MGRKPLDPGNGDDEAVGYGRPPRATRIKDGEKRNPYGRRGKPKPAVDFLQGLVRMTIDGKTKLITRDEAIDHLLFKRVAEGSVSAARFLELRGQKRAPSPGQAGTNLTPSEEKSLERFIRREANRLSREDPS